MCGRSYAFPDVLEPILTGVVESDCPLPCETILTETKLATSANTQDWTGITINFQQDVEVRSEN